MTASVLYLIAGLVGAPLLQGVVNRTKAVFAGRRGAPLLQPYRDIARLLRKSAVFSGTTTLVFRAAPSVVLVCMLAALALVGPPGERALLSFQGDFVLFAYCLGLARFLTVVAALDTGSSFEGMGASREVMYSALAEPALLVGLAVIAGASGSVGLSGVWTGLDAGVWTEAAPALVLVIASFAIVLLAENSRIPFDDPNTHLELTMVHEVMVLDNSGPDFGIVEYASSLKLWLFGSLVVNLALTPLELAGMASAGAALGGLLVLAIVTGVIESVMARLSLQRAPQLLMAACALSVLAFVLQTRFMR
jgi:formate hydrogenlyase subunit 4